MPSKMLISTIPNILRCVSRIIYITILIIFLSRNHLEAYPEVPEDMIMAPPILYKL